MTRIGVVGQAQEFFLAIVVSRVAVAVKQGATLIVGRVRILIKDAVTRLGGRVGIPYLSRVLGVRRSHQTVFGALTGRALRRVGRGVDARDLGGTVFFVVKQIRVETGALPALAGVFTLFVGRTVGGCGPHVLARVHIASLFGVFFGKTKIAFGDFDAVDFELTVALHHGTAEFSRATLLAVAVRRAHAQVFGALGERDRRIGKVTRLNFGEGLDILRKPKGFDPNNVVECEGD